MGDDSRGARGRTGRRAGSSTLTPPTGLPATPDDAVVLPPPAAVVDPCVCAHGHEAHEHWRRGTDCGICGRAGCARFRPAGGRLRRLLRRGHLKPR